MEILQTNNFKKPVKTLYPNQKIQLNKAVKAILSNPLIGEQKLWDLANVRVYKFHMYLIFQLEPSCEIIETSFLNNECNVDEVFRHLLPTSLESAVKAYEKSLGSVHFCLE